MASGVGAFVIPISKIKDDPLHTRKKKVVHGLFDPSPVSFGLSIHSQKSGVGGARTKVVGGDHRKTVDELAHLFIGRVVVDLLTEGSQHSVVKHRILGRRRKLVKVLNVGCVLHDGSKQIFVIKMEVDQAIDKNT